MPPEEPVEPPAGIVGGLDHLSLPMQDADAMTEFYRSLGLEVAETPHLVQVFVGSQMINFHRTATWQRDGFTLRAPAAKPPCGDICFVWDGSAESLKELLGDAGAEIIEGPVERQGGRRAAGSSVYVRDPDGNLLEFISYRLPRGLMSPDIRGAHDAPHRGSSCPSLGGACRSGPSSGTVADG